jgi:hypothetical protein
MRVGQKRFYVKSIGADERRLVLGECPAPNVERITFRELLCGLL